jgi:DNA-binding SARP family transcriptional activator
LDGVAYGWVEGPREDTRRWAVDALARLAELRQAADDLPGAVEALERAIIADPVVEELYRRLMRLQADLERPDAERRTYRPLARRLAELQSRTGTSSSNSPCRASRSSWQTTAWISLHPAA